MTYNERIIAIFRKAKKGKVSSRRHLYLIHDFFNQQRINNQNINQDNVVLTYNKEDDSISFDLYKRNKTFNVKPLKDRENEIDKKARADYTAFKEEQKLLEKSLAEKECRKPKRITTVLRTENLTKEFVIAFGSTDKENKLTREDLPFTKDKFEFSKMVMDGVEAILEKQGLTVKDNLISACIHYDEAGLPGVHCQYNDYSFTHKTTASELFRCRDKTLTKKEQWKVQNETFSVLQDTLATAMKLQRGEKNSKRRHLEINAYRVQEQLKQIADVTQNLNTNKVKNLELKIENNNLNNTNNDKHEELSVLNQRVATVKAKVEDVEKKWTETEKIEYDFEKEQFAVSPTILARGFNRIAKKFQTSIDDVIQEFGSAGFNRLPNFVEKIKFGISTLRKMGEKIFSLKTDIKEVENDLIIFKPSKEIQRQREFKRDKNIIIE